MYLTLGGGATFLIRPGGGGVRTIGSTESRPERLCSPVTSASVSSSLSSVYRCVRTSSRTGARHALFRLSSSSSSLQAPLASSRRSLQCSYLEHRLLGGVSPSSLFHGVEKRVEVPQQPLHIFDGYEWQFGKQWPEMRPHLGSSPRDPARTVVL